MTNTSAELAVEGYRSAKSFWETWHNSDDAEFMFGVRNASDLVAGRLIQEYGMVPREAAFVSQLANQSVIETLFER